MSTINISEIYARTVRCGELENMKEFISDTIKKRITNVLADIKKEREFPEGIRSYGDFLDFLTGIKIFFAEYEQKMQEEIKDLNIIIPED